jgi:hypothetical protein
MRPTLVLCLVKKNATFGKWLEQPKSTVLVLSGSNWVEDLAIQLNWLFFASIWMATEMQQSSITLSFFCQTEYRLVSPSKRRTFQNVVCNLIY